MRLKVLERFENLPLIDLISGRSQVFENSPPDISQYFTKNNKNFDAYLVPHDASDWTRKYFALLKTVQQEKPLLFFNRSDFPRNVTLPNAYSLQNAVTFRPRYTNVIVIPYNISPLPFFGLRNKSQIPIISFVGFVPRISPGRILSTWRQMPSRPLKANPIVIREMGIRAISKSVFEHHIIIRDQYGGARSTNPNYKVQREEFEESIRLSDFVFCPRGDGNSSRRFFEAISAGRIPIVPNSDIVLPSRIALIENLVYLPVRTLSSDLNEKIQTYWNEVSAKEYLEAQQQNLKLFAEQLNYSRFLHLLFSSPIETLFTHKI